jgi:hypothetical protein
MRRIVSIIVSLSLLCASRVQCQSTSALVTNNGLTGQALNFTNVNGYTPIVNGFPVIVGEAYQPGLTGTSVNAVIFANTANPWTFGIYNLWCTIGASSITSSPAIVTISVSYTDAVSGNLFNLTLATPLTLSTTAPTLVSTVHFAASNATSITTSTVLVTGAATFTKDCYLTAANHH